MVKEIPLPLILGDGMVVSPATIGMLSHDDTLEIPRAKWRLRHGIGQRLSSTFLPYPWESEIVPPALLESIGTFLETVGQSFHHLTTYFHRRHFRHALPFGELYLL